MKTSIGIPQKIWLKLSGFLCLVFLFSCEAEPLPQENLQQFERGLELQAKKAIHNPVEVITTHMDLEVASILPSGWTTFRYQNRSNNTHFFVLEKLPGDKTVEDSKAEVVPVFQEGMDHIASGDWDAALAAFGNLPAWYSEVIFSGGSGLLSPISTSEISVYLEPGNYVLECYVKSPGGVFHSANGMISGLVVTADGNGYREPTPTMEVNISSETGITFDEKLRPGKHRIQVNFEDQAVYSHFLGHDVHLVKLEENADINELNAWMNWSDPSAFKSPAPRGIIFMGGMQDLPARLDLPESQVGYFEAHLEPGTYAFIAEVPDPMSRNMFRIFTVPSGAE